MKVVDENPDILMLQVNDDIYNIGQDIIHKLQVNSHGKEKSPDGLQEKLSSSPPRAKCGRPANPTPRHKRESHIKAEYKRRDKIQKGFETLKDLVPSLGESSPKESKSAKLLKTVDYCRQLKADSKSRQDEASALRAELEALGSQIHMLQKHLPASGISVVDKPCQMDTLYEDYVKNRTKQNWKFWIFSYIMKPLYDSYQRIVATRTPTEFMRTVIEWAKDQLSLTSLRPGVFTSLRQMSTQTKIMDKPEDLPRQAMEMVSGVSGTLPTESPETTSLDSAADNQSSFSEVSSSSLDMDFDSLLNVLERNDTITMTTTSESSNQSIVSSTSSLSVNSDSLLDSIDSLITDSLLNSLNGSMEEPMSTSSYPNFSDSCITAQSTMPLTPLSSALSIDSVFSTKPLTLPVQSDMPIDSIFCTQTSPLMVQSNSTTNNSIFCSQTSPVMVHSSSTDSIFCTQMLPSSTQAEPVSCTDYQRFVINGAPISVNGASLSTTLQSLYKNL